METDNPWDKLVTQSSRIMASDFEKGSSRYVLQAHLKLRILQPQPQPPEHQNCRPCHLWLPHDLSKKQRVTLCFILCQIVQGKKIQNKIQRRNKSRGTRWLHSWAKKWLKIWVYHRRQEDSHIPETRCYRNIFTTKSRQCYQRSLMRLLIQTLNRDLSSHPFSFILLFKITFLHFNFAWVCVHAWTSVHATHTCGGQRATCRTQFSPVTVLGPVRSGCLRRHLTHPQMTHFNSYIAVPSRKRLYT